MPDFKVGQLIIVLKGDVVIGKIKRICDDGKSAFVWYHSGSTAAKTPFDIMIPICNEYCITDTILGGKKEEEDV